MVQMALTDGGLVSEPYRHFTENEAIYRYIGERLDATREAYLDADAPTRRQLLFDSATYALLTANTPLAQADRAFEIYTEHYPFLDPDDLAHDFEQNGIGFHHNKAEYICSNDEDRGIFRLADSHLPDRPVEAQSVLMDASGLGPAKSAFALSMLGFTSCICLDTHTCQQLGIDPRSYDKHTAQQYRDMADDALDQVSDLCDEVSPFLAQWVIFDLNRNEIETHDDWFVHVDGVLSED